MIRVSKFRRRSNGYWYLRYSLSGRLVDESTRTRGEPPAEAMRIRREIEINSGFEPVKHADVGDLIAAYLDSMPPKTTASHRRVARRAVVTFLQLCGRKGRNGAYHIRYSQIRLRELGLYDPKGFRLKKTSYSKRRTARQRAGPARSDP